MRGAVTGRPALLVGLVSIVALLAGLGAWRAPGQGARPPSLDGPCRVTARLTPGGVQVDPSVTGGVYTVPPSATIAYDAVLSAADQGRRRLQGHVVLDLPPPLPDVTLASWDEVGGLPDTTGLRRYDLPGRWAPTGLTLRVSAVHQEPALRCAGTLDLRLGGGGTTSLLRPIAVALLIAAAWAVSGAGRPGRGRRRDPWMAGTARPGEDPAVEGAVALAGPGAPLHGREAADTDRTGPSRSSIPPTSSTPPAATDPSSSTWRRGRRLGRPGYGALTGLLFGLAADLVLLLTSAVALQSAWLSVGLVAGVAVGIAIGVVGAAPDADPSAGGDDLGDAPELAVLDVEAFDPDRPAVR